MRRCPRALPLIALLALFAAGPAQALSPEAAEAEHTRLSEEMRKLARRNAWHGVEKQYIAMLELRDDGVRLSYDDHMMGAQAARELGQITSVYQRLQRAEGIQAKEEVTSWLSEIRASYGEVLLVRDEKFKGDTALNADAMPFDPAKRAAIGAAQQHLLEDPRFDGLLPHGSYSFGGKAFTVAPDQAAKVEVILANEGANTKRLARAPTRSGLRLVLGPGISQVGGSNGGGTGPQPADSAGGALLRAALGGNVPFGESPVGLVVQGGLHWMLPSDRSVLGATEADLANNTFAQSSGVLPSDARATMTGFFAEVGPAVWIDAIGLEVAVTPGVFIGSVETVSRLCGASCDEADRTSNYYYTQLNWQDDNQGLVAPGLSLGAMWVPESLAFKLGRGTYGAGVGLQTGAWADAARLYPWGQLALSILPYQAPK